MLVRFRAAIGSRGRLGRETHFPIRGGPRGLSSIGDAGGDAEQAYYAPQEWPSSAAGMLQKAEYSGGGAGTLAPLAWYITKRSACEWAGRVAQVGGRILGHASRLRPQWGQTGVRGGFAGPVKLSTGSGEFGPDAPSHVYGLSIDAGCHVPSAGGQMH